MKFGVNLPGTMSVGMPPWTNSEVLAGVQAVAKRADELGFEYVACCDHPVIPSEDGPFLGTRWFDPVATLGYAAGMTSRVKLLTSVVILPYRSPFDLAKSMGTLDSLSGGRVILGVGIGHLKKEFEVVGADYRNRAIISDEYIQAIKALWSSDVASFHGEHLYFDDLMSAPRPASEPHPPVWVGGSSLAAIRRAVRYGEGWHPMPMNVEKYANKVGYARRYAEEIGRVEPLVCTAQLQGVEPIRSANRRTDNIGGGSGAADEPLYTRHTSNARMTSPLTTAAGINAQVQAYEEAGAHVMGVGFRFQDLETLLESMDWFAREVMRQNC